MSSQTKSQVIPLIAIIVLSFLGIKALFHSGLYTAHDIWHQVARLYQYSHAVVDGQLFPNWIATMANGYGYPLFFFSYHFPWMLGTPLVLSGMSVELTLKILFGAAFTFSGVSFYLLAHKLSTQKLPSLIGAFIYLYAPYHFLSMYVSASIGSVFFFFLVPLLILGIVFVLEGKRLLGSLLIILTLAASILTHLMSLAIFAPFLGLFVVFLLAAYYQKSAELYTQLAWLLVSAVVSILLSAFYVVPLLTYLKLTVSQDIAGFADLYQTNFVYFKQLLYSPWGFGPIISNAKDGELSFQVGIAQWLSVALLVIVLLVGMVIIFSKKKKRSLPIIKVIAQLIAPAPTQTLLVCTGIVVSLSSVLAAMTDVGKPFWKFFTTHVVVIDYPFRLLLLAVFFASLAAVYAFSLLKSRYLMIAGGVVLCVIAIYTNRNHMRVNLYTDFDLDLYVRSEQTTSTFNEYLPKSAQSVEINKELPLIKNDLPFQVEQRTTRITRFSIDLPEDTHVTVRQLDFPGQSVTVDGQHTMHTQEDGLIQVPLAKGHHQVMIGYTDTPVVKVSKLISLLTALALLGVGTWYKLRKAL